MWYLAIRRDIAPRQSWTATLDEHLSWMKAQHDAGAILFSGPTADIYTGIYVIRASSVEEASRIAADDPFTRAGHCAFELHQWDVRQALGMGPFSTAELDAMNKAWRSAWKDTAGSAAANGSASTKPEGADASTASVAGKAEIPSAATRDWTAGEMRFQLEPAMEEYVVSRSSGYGPAGAALVAATAALGEPAVMMIAKEQYAFFRVLAGMPGCRNVLDVGTFTGLSALAFADGMVRGGRVVTIDRNAAWADIARTHWTAAGVADRIDVRIGEAIDVLAALAAHAETRFDLIFLDVDKARVPEYFELALALLAPGGLVMVDNALWHGWVRDPARNDADTQGMREFNDRIGSDGRVDAALLPIADGLWLIRRRG